MRGKWWRSPWFAVGAFLLLMAAIGATARFGVDDSPPDLGETIIRESTVHESTSPSEAPPEETPSVSDDPSDAEPSETSAPTDTSWVTPNRQSTEVNAPDDDDDDD
ncbi:MAG: hypothetical protein Q4P71_02985 [Actinomycetaceae bacterium]|nr:hypothetical protein [Actinomycetaceae bacterium]